MPRWLVKRYFCMTLWVCLWKRIAFELADLVKINLTKVVGCHLILGATEGLDRTKRSGKGELTLFVSWDIHLLLPLDFDAPGSWTLGLRLGHTSLPTEFSCLQTGAELYQQLFFFSSLWMANCRTSQPPCQQEPISMINFYVCICVCVWFSQFSCSVVYDSLQPHKLQNTRLPCPSATPGACSNSCPSSQWCIQPPHPLSSPSPPAFNLSRHRGLFQRVSSLHQYEGQEHQLQHKLCQWIFRTDFL